MPTPSSGRVAFESQTPSHAPPSPTESSQQSCPEDHHVSLDAMDDDTEQLDPSPPSPTTVPQRGYSRNGELDFRDSSSLGLDQDLGQDGTHSRNITTTAISPPNVENTSRLQSSPYTPTSTTHRDFLRSLNSSTSRTTPMSPRPRSPASSDNSNTTSNPLADEDRSSGGDNRPRNDERSTAAFGGSREVDDHDDSSSDDGDGRERVVDADGDEDEQDEPSDDNVERGDNQTNDDNVDNNDNNDDYDDDEDSIDPRMMDLESVAVPSHAGDPMDMDEGRCLGADMLGPDGHTLAMDIGCNEYDGMSFALTQGLTAIRVVPTSPSSFLRPGSCFQGTQTSERSVYKVDVEIKHVDMRESFLCGYLHIEGLTPDNPSICTYFEGEIIGPKYGFLTKHKCWGADERTDISHWSKFGAFRPYAKSLKRGLVKDVDFSQKENIFMRWKEHFLVPDHRKSSIPGASFEGFYYICFNQVKGEVAGIYFHARSEKFQQLDLQHIHQHWRFNSIEFR